MSQESRPKPGVIRVLIEQATNKRIWWGYAVIALGILLALAIRLDPQYQAAWIFIRDGVWMTLLLTILSFGIALIVGLFVGLARVSSNPILYNIATFYVELIRGVPILVQLLFVAFVLFPSFVDMFSALGSGISIRDIDMSVRAMLGFSIAYGAFEAEVFRGGIESIDRGQMEAARSLGMSYSQAMRYVILPQAFRRVLPPLGNDFIAMLKDTSLATVLAVREVTHLSRQHRSNTFTTFQPLIVATGLYLLMTLVLSRLVRYLEWRMSPNE